jgi:hypothetical protein
VIAPRMETQKIIDEASHWRYPSTHFS